MITLDKFCSYEDVKESGETNMFDFKTIEILSGLTTSEIKYIMSNYTKLKNKFINEYRNN